MVTAIDATPNGHGLARRLADYVLKAQEVDLWQIRPLKLARDWKIGRRAGDRALPAGGAGGLAGAALGSALSRAAGWRSPRSASLDQLPTGAHCSSCNIDYDRDFSKNVEASFRPAPRRARRGVRPILPVRADVDAAHQGCISPLEAGAAREVTALLRAGRLSPAHAGARAGAGDRLGRRRLPGGGDRGRPLSAAAAGDAGIHRAWSTAARRPLTFIVEDRAWVQDALTADRITALQAFRDLFASEALRAGRRCRHRRRSP